MLHSWQLKVQGRDWPSVRTPDSCATREERPFRLPPLRPTHPWRCTRSSTGLWTLLFEIKYTYWLLHHLNRHLMRPSIEWTKVIGLIELLERIQTYEQHCHAVPSYFFQRFLLEILIRLKVLSFQIFLTNQSAHSCRNINQNYRILLKCGYNRKVDLKVEQKCPMQLEIILEQSLSLSIKDWDQSIGISRNIAYSSWQVLLVTMTL